ncbi:12682_t:CDS:2 [Ambispora gerdemannii]|uniref:12682_t:CDS:1 n=1 Tax=Ambispora gerdemannii TaxID=144530 RepID=A0A9N9CMM8_9GLOM|nr:12682_t:CDS:2 [Ambispora gerdemannii]
MSLFFKQLYFHALSPSKTVMDTRHDLEMYRKDGAEEQEGTRSLQQVPSTIQEEQSIPFPYRPQWTSETDDNKGWWDNNHHNHPVGRPLLSIHHQLSVPKKNSKKKMKFTYLKQLSVNNQRILEIEPAKDYQSRIRSVNHGSQEKGQRLLDHNPTGERPISFSSRSEWERDPRPRIFTDKSSDATMPKLPELLDMLKNDHRRIHETTDHSGMVVWMLDDRGIMFQWNEMSQNMDCMGANLREEELRRRTKEEWARSLMAEPIEMVWEGSAKKRRRRLKNK